MQLTMLQRRSVLLHRQSSALKGIDAVSTRCSAVSLCVLYVTPIVLIAA